MKDSTQFNHISETAVWVAYYRAMESKRNDALFNDPFAGVLSGEEGKQYVKNLKGGKSSAWSMIVRTKVIDEMIGFAIAREGVDTIVNLAAGLDTRPYRLDLPSTLRWIEVDLPEILAFKEEKLSGSKPQCTLERIPLDLTDRNSRIKLLEQINQEAKQVLVITEGLLIYLKEEEVNQLAVDLMAQPGFGWWINDIMTPELKEWLLKSIFKQFQSGNIQMHFAPAEGVDFFKKCGWESFDLRYMSKESKRLNREMPSAWLYRLLGMLASKKQREFFSKFETYIVLLKRNSTEGLTN